MDRVTLLMVPLMVLVSGLPLWVISLMVTYGGGSPVARQERVLPLADCVSVKLMMRGLTRTLICTSLKILLMLELLLVAVQMSVWSVVALMTSVPFSDTASVSSSGCGDFLVQFVTGVGSPTAEQGKVSVVPFSTDRNFLQFPESAHLK